ncbi:hypothetical protein ACQP2T_28070 [Nonomuraea sp. CA-143628]|uniref:hypothetical protein n=1 Tax=Nonomuraea sp. CA-143628 TaxID=3239997 RepID=UPI003D901E63
MANQTALGFTIFAREHASKAFKQVASDLDRLEKRMQTAHKAAGKGLGLAALAGGAVALTQAVLPAAAAVAALPAALVATKVATGVLKVGLIGVGDAMSAVAEGDAKKLDEALDKLSPNAKAFVRELAGLKKSFDPVQRAVQDKLFDGLAAQMGPVARNLLPTVKTGMLGVAAGFNSAAKEAIAFASTDLGKGTVNKVFAGTSRTMGILAGAVQPALRAVSALIGPSFTLAERMAQWAVNGAKAASAFLTSERGAAMLQRTVDKAGDTLAQLGRIGGNVAKGLAGVLSQAKGAGDGLLDTLEQGTAKFAAWSRSVEGQQQAAETFRLLHDAAVAVVDVLPVLLGPLGAIVKLINGLPGPLRDGAVQFIAVAVVVGTLVSKLRPLLTVVGGVASAFTSADGPIQKFKDRIGGMEAPAAKVRGALSGITGVLGGPWGIALTLGIGAVSMFAAKQAEADQRVRDLTETLDKQTGAITADTRALAVQRLEQDGLLAVAQQLGISLDTVTNAALGNQTALAQVNSVLDAYGNKLRDAAASEQVAGAGTDELSKGSVELRLALQGQNQELNEAIASSRRSAEAMGPAAAAGRDTAASLNGVGAAASTANVKVSSLNTTLAKFRSLNGDADLAAIAFRDSIDELTTAFSKNNVQIDQRTGKININSKAGREANRVLIGSIQAAIEHSAKVRDQTGSVDKANKVFATEITRLRGVLQQSGLSRAEIDKLVARYTKLPGQINSATGKIKNRRVMIEVKAGGKLVGFHVNVNGSGGTVLNASGGIMPDVLPGYTPGRDVHTFYGPNGGKIGLSGGEAVMRPEWTRAVGSDYVKQMNAIARSGGTKAVAEAMGVGPRWSSKMRGEGVGYASGGIIAKHSVTGLSSVQKMASRANSLYGGWASQMGAAVSKEYNKLWLGGPGVQNALKWARNQAGKPYVWGGVGPGGYDCSGFMSAITNVIKGRKPYNRLFTTWSFGNKTGPQGFVRNRPSGFRVGISDAGVGHMAGTLGGVNVESSGSKGVRVGSAARGATNGMFSRRYGLKLATGGLVPTFDNGGMLPPGTSMVHNGTGAPEPLANLDKMPPVDVRLLIDSAGSRLDDLLVEVLRRAVRVRGGNVQTVLGR